MRTTIRTLVLVLASAAVGCSSAITRPRDAGTDALDELDAARPRIELPPAPTPPTQEPSVLSGPWITSTDASALASANPVRSGPSAPDFDTCPAGWTGGGSVACEPWPSGHRTCTGAEEHFPGETGCRAIGICPSTTVWADDLPTSGTILYVQPSAGPGGDGSQSQPFRALGDALSEAALRAPPVVIALADGTYNGAITLPAGATLWGACPARTILSANASDSIVRAGTASALRNLRVSGSTNGIEVPAGTSIVLDRVLVDGMSSSAIEIAGGSAQGSEVVLRSSVGESGRGAHLVTGTLVLDRSVIRAIGGTDGYALRADRGNVTLTNVAAVDNAYGVTVDSTSAAGTGSLAVDGVVVEDGDTGLQARFLASMVARRSVVRRMSWFGVWAVSNGSATIDGVFVEDVRGWGVAVGGGAGTVSVDDLLIRDVARIPAGAGDGLLTWACTATLARIRIERTAALGLGTWENANVTGSSIEVIDSGEDPNQASAGTGIHVTDGANLRLTNARVVGARGVGVSAGGCISGQCWLPGDPPRWGFGTVVELTDVEVRDTRVSSDPLVPMGIGVLATGGASAVLTRVSSIGSAVAQLAAGSSALGLDPLRIVANGNLELTDVLLRGAGAAIVAGDGSRIDANRTVVSGPSGVAIEARGTMSTVVLNDAIVADVNGAGLVARDGAAISANRAWLGRISDLAVHASLSSIAITDSRFSQLGAGVRAELAGSATLTRVHVSDVEGTVLETSGAESELHLQDLDVEEQAAGTGFGLLALSGASVSAGVIRMNVDRPAIVVLTDRDTTISGSDFTLRCGDASTGSCAPFAALAASSATIDGLLADRGRGIGVAAFGAATTVTLTRVLALSTVLGPCDGQSCASAIGAYDGATLLAREFQIDTSAAVGAQLGDAQSVLVLSNGTIERASVGVAGDVSLSDVRIAECATDVSAEAGLRPDAPSAR